jgi:hypothetical protein
MRRLTGKGGNLPGLILACLLGACLLYAVGVEVGQSGPRVVVPAGVARVSFGTMGRAAPADAGQARPGDYLKAVPRSVRALDQHRVLIEGFMIPVQNEGRGVREFLLVPNQASCCFGFPLRATDVVVVHMAGQPAESLRDRVLATVGRLHVREQWSGPFLGSLYQMDGESVVAEAPAMPLTRPPDPGLE